MADHLTSGVPTPRLERLQVGGQSLEVIRGGGGPTVLLLHGPCNYSPDAPFLRQLCKSRSVIAPSHPGFGNSARPENFDTIYDLIHLYLELLDGLVDDRVTLVGCSFGGWLAAEIAVSCSHRLDRLILVDPVGIKIGGRDERDIVHLFNTSPAEVSRRGWHDPTRQRPGLLGVGWQQQFEALSDEELVVAARNWDALCLYAWHPHLFNPRLKDWLHRISVPTLLLWGASDEIVTVQYGQAYSRLIPGARLEVIPEAGHHPELEQPLAFSARLNNFLEGPG